jgi:hypothetical protein
MEHEPDSREKYVPGNDREAIAASDGVSVSVACQRCAVLTQVTGNDNVWPQCGQAHSRKFDSSKSFGFSMIHFEFMIANQPNVARRPRPREQETERAINGKLHRRRLAGL